MGLRRFIMGYRVPHSQKEHIKVTKNLKFGVDRANVAATVRTSLFLSKFCVFFNGCISFTIGPINTKLENVANFNVLFLTIRLSYCLSHISIITLMTIKNRAL